MPRVKIDYVVSFSSEDPENQANNLLAWDVGKEMWLCTMGESSCSVVLQLARAVKVESITIGTYHTALLEVLVGLSEKPDAPFEALVPRCAVLSPREARALPAPRVRSFTRDSLVATVADRRWDRLRVVCSQPYDKHCKYGLSFVHLFEPETPKPSALNAVSQRLLRLDALSEDEEEFSPRELFAKFCQEMREQKSTDAQIRQTTTQALKNIPDSSTKLVKTPLNGKRKRSMADDERIPTGARPFSSILSGVVFSLSGYVNPERASLRATAVSMGAQYRADWKPDCTHLICAFPNTPRLRMLRSSSSDAPVPAATGAWLKACERAGRRLPWRAFATEPHLRDANASEDDGPAAGDDGDTDDEIEKVLQKTKKKRVTRRDDSSRHRSSPPGSKSLPPDDISNDSNVIFVRDERVLGTVTIDSDDDVTDAYDDVTDHEQYEQETEEIDEEKSLPLNLDGVSVNVCGLSPRSRNVVSRYVTAYGGLAMDFLGGYTDLPNPMEKGTLSDLESIRTFLSS